MKASARHFYQTPTTIKNGAADLLFPSGLKAGCAHIVIHPRLSLMFGFILVRPTMINIRQRDFSVGFPGRVSGWAKSRGEQNWFEGVEFYNDISVEWNAQRKKGASLISISASAGEELAAFHSLTNRHPLDGVYFRTLTIKYTVDAGILSLSDRWQENVVLSTLLQHVRCQTGKLHPIWSRLGAARFTPICESP